MSGTIVATCPLPSIDASRSRTDILDDVLPLDGVFDARDLLSAHPRLRSDKSLALDVIYEDYCRRQEAGEAVDPDEFCERFPSYRASVGRLLQVRNLLSGRSFLFADDGPIAWPRPGDYFLGFALRRRLGRGRFARVFLATEPNLGDRLVAVKISRHGTVEANTLGQLSHPNVVPIHSVRTDENTGLSAVCMPYMGSATLCDLLDRILEAGLPTDAAIIDEVSGVRDLGCDVGGETSALTPQSGNGSYVRAVAKIGAQLADALAFVHRQGIYHQDFKPSNVLLAMGGRPVLLDFNLSINVRETGNIWGGTPAYMAPEILHALSSDPEGAAGTPDPRSDVFSLGVVLFELLTGVHPFAPIPHLPPIELAAVLMSRQSSPRRALCQLNPMVSRSLAHVVDRCIAFRMSDRPPSAAEAARLLRAALAPRHRKLAWFTDRPLRVAVLGLAVGVGGAALWGARDANPIPVDVPIENGSAPVTPEACLAHARYLQQRGRFAEALDYYEMAGSLASDGATLACMGYCLSCLGYHEQAESRYQEAMTAGEDSLGLWNNRGYSLLESKKRSPEHWIPQALKALSRAITLDPLSQVAHYNRTLIYFEIGRLKLGRHRPDGVPDEATAVYLGLADIENAIRLGPPFAELYLTGGRLAALSVPIWNLPRVSAIPMTSEPLSVTAITIAAGSLPEAGIAAIYYLEKAIEHGANPADMGSDRALTGSLGQNPSFRALCESEWTPTGAPRVDRLINPMP